jgi:nicotinamidase-related amidase
MFVLQEQLRQWKTRSVVLCGIEAHACIYHTAIDLLENGYTVHVVADACSSRSQSDR